MRGWMRVAAMVTLVGTTLFSGCNSGSSTVGTASLRLLNASPGYPALDLQVAGLATSSSNLGYGAVGTYAAASNAGVSTVIAATGSTAALSTATRTLTKDAHYTLVAYGPAGALKSALISEDVVAPVAGLAALNVLNLAPDAGAVDIYLTGNADDLGNATPIASAVSGSGSTGYISETAGTYRLRVTGNGDKTDLRLDVQGLVLGSAQVATLMLTASSGGVLVNSVLLVQQGVATPLSNKQARVRVVSAVSGNGIVTANVAGSALADKATSPAIGNYTLLTASAQSAVGGTVLSGGVSYPWAVPNQALIAGADYTMLVWGDATKPQFTLIADDNRYPSVTTKANVRLVNATTGATAALTLQANLFPIANNVAQGQASSYVSVVADAATAVNIDSTSKFGWYVSNVNGVKFAAKGLYTVFVFGDSAASSVAQVQVRLER